MRQIHPFLWTAFTLLTLALIACNNSQPVPTLMPVAVVEDAVQTAVATEPAPAPAAVSTLEPTYTPESAGADVPTVTPEVAENEAEDTPVTAALNGSNNYGEPDVNSYRISLRFESTLVGADGSQNSGTIMLEGARDVAPDAMTFTANASGTADFGSGQQMTFTRIGETVYALLPNGSCTSFVGAPPGMDLYDTFIASGGMLGNLEGAEPGIPPTETVNGVLTNHYVFNETNLNPVDPTTPQVTSVNGDIYLAADGGYVVRILMNGTGSSTLLNDVAGESDISYELNYFDFDVPVEIAPPAGCSDPAPTGDYPVLEDAAGLLAAEGMFTYNSSTSFEEAVAFYQEAMAAEGWTLAQELAAGPATLFTFTQGADTVQISITQEENGITVAIISQP